MRTTVDIPEALHKRLKKRAADEKTTIRELLLRGVEIAVEDRPIARRKLKLPLLRSKNPGSLHLTNKQINDILFP
jgi:methyl coenzyme M reductase subunit C-like uncharacterized protein (methanogenesis marker protein 7)